jgi:hypothetical protein
MAVSYCDELDVCLAIRDRLRECMPGLLTSKTCFIAAEPVPRILPSGDITVTIFNAGTQYDENTYMGAGGNALDNGLTIMVTLIVRCGSDSPPKSETALIDQQRGLLSYRRPILNALLVSDTQHCEGNKDQWVMMIKGNQVLRERGPIPRGWNAPQYDRIGNELYISSTLTLSMNFDQDL